MVDTSTADVSIPIAEHTQKTKMPSLYTTRLDATIARFFCDDADVRAGALSAPHTRFRPGLRDDESVRPIANMLSVL